MDSEYQLLIYKTDTGKEPFNDWLKSLKNKDTQALIFQRLQRIRLGNFGDCKSLQNGLWEFRIHAGAGYRIYYTVVGKRIILLFFGGNKTNQNKNIKLASKYLEEYRGKTNEKTK